ncbi:hypothetical protein BV20DRAFT_181132 [Pilatotrama ljubarskyi]|nr:hypothetical protein BV20DRAFT_181132 [Pilatotrama ljubarskyi]
MREAQGWSKLPGVCGLCHTGLVYAACTYTDPSHKRGPPKGYIVALERRLHQVEALLGTIIGSDDPRARSLIQDLSNDKLASYIINKVHIGPFGPAGRTSRPFSSTKEDFLASITGDLGDNTSEQSMSSQDAPNDPAFLSPSREWQDRMKNLLSAARLERSTPTSVMSPPPEVKLRRATYPSASAAHSPLPLMQPYQATPQPASNSTLFYSHGHSLGQMSVMRSSVEHTGHQAAPQGQSAHPTMGNVYTDPDGRFRLANDASFPRDASGSGIALADATAQYYSSFRR